MKLKFIIGILALLLLTVGTASAGDVHLTVPNNQAYANYGIDIFVQYEGNTITFTDQSPSALDLNIFEVGIQLPDATYRISPVPDGWTVAYDFDPEKGFGESSFGRFNCQVKKSGSTQTNQLELTLNKDLPTTMTPNDAGNIFVTHVKWDAVPDLAISKGSGWFGIPEFPTIALPVAAILGLMLIFGRRKQE